MLLVGIFAMAIVITTPGRLGTFRCRCWILDSVGVCCCGWAGVVLHFMIHLQMDH